MANVSPNNITNMNQDWGNDATTNLPFSGAAVQAFIKSQLGIIPRAAYFDGASATMYWFKSEEDRNEFIGNPQLINLPVFSVPITFSSDLFRINLTNNVGTTTLNVATNQTEVVLSIAAEVQTKAITDSVWTGTNSGVYVTAQIDPGASGIYDDIHEPRLITAGGTYTIDVRSLLLAGANRVRLQFVDEDDSTVTTSITYTINLTEMFIEPLNNQWYLPIIEGGDIANYQLGGFRIVGSLNKMLHVDIYTNDSKVKEFTYNVGVSSYDQVPFYYTKANGFDLATGTQLQTGVYYVSAYLTSGSGADMLVTAPVNYNIMYVAEEDAATAQLVCINDVRDVVFNYTTSTMFSYSIYNKGLLTGSPAIQIKQITGTSPVTTIDTVLENVSCAAEHTYEIDLEWITEETVNLSVRADMQYGNNQTATSSVDNSATFPPTFGFNFYMNSAARANSDTNKLKLVNQVTSGVLTPTWTRMSWVDGIDGWTTDDSGRKCLYIPAGSKMSLPYSEYGFLPGDGITFEMCYRISNVADYNENVITIADNPTSAGFRGIRIRPTNITVHSSADNSDANDLVRGTNVMDEEIIHFVLTIYPNFKGYSNRNLVTGYINGCKNFQFSYVTGSLWNVTSPLVIGSDKSDVSLYYIRTYNTVLSDANVQANYINSIPTVAARKDLAELMKSVMDSKGTDISYESVKNSQNNFFVIEMIGGSSVPSRANGWTKDTNIAARSNLEMHFGKHPAWDWKIENVETMGQGTTSMGYYRWNLRWRIDKSTNKKVNVSYLSSRTERAGSYSYTWEDPVSVGTINFDGAGNHPALKRMTAKINFASSMQSHKIGATRAFTELHDAVTFGSSVGLPNEAQAYADDQNLAMPALAVYEYPAYGFAKYGNEYVYIGMFTIGPDKGDKPTFGYDINSDIKSNLITLEGTDHSRKMVMFNAPWNSDVQFLSSNECLNIIKGTNDYDNGWEVGNCHDLDTGDAADQADINTVLVDEFKPAYDLAFNNSTLIMPVALNTYGATASATLSYINSHIANFQSIVDSDGRMTYANYQFWIENEYVLYYYDIVSGRYVAGVNLVSEHGTPSGSTLTEKNNWFKQKRRERFMATAENYWDISDALFHMAFLVIFGAMDNFGKNTYPYKMKTLASGGRWKWRQDDLDSILGIGNAGADNMPSWMEFTDSNNGSVYFGGSTSVFWNLINECYYEDYVSTVTSSTKPGFVTMGRAILNTMVSLAGGSNSLEGITNFFKSRFWDNAQEYFPQSAYNADAAFKYEAAWLANDNQQADPLTQSLGNHYSAERLWSERRIVYMMSLFKVGPFGSYADSTLGQIAFRPQSLQELEITPSMDLYPAFASGQGMVSTDRTRLGESHTFVGPFGTDGQTSHYINATNYITSLGDLSDLRFGAQYVTDPLNINGEKLVSFKIGDENSSNVSTNVTGITFTNTPCLETIDARNAESVSGVIDVSGCRRLRELYLEGTSVSQVTLADGQTINVLHFPDSVGSIIMKNLKFLTDESVQFPTDLDEVALIQIEGCSINAFDITYDAYAEDNSALRYISVAFPGIVEISSAKFIYLLNLIANKDKNGNDVVGGYHGVSASGAPLLSANPRFEGTVQLTGPAYQSDIDSISDGAEDYGVGLKRALLNYFGGLYLIFNPNNLYIDFEDSNVLSVLLANNIGDGVGVTTAAAANANIGTIFKENSTITSFDELRYFKPSGVPSYAFQGCSSLKSVTLPNGFPTRIYLFDRCTSLEEITFLGDRGVEEMSFSGYCFMHCNNLTRVKVPSMEVFMMRGFQQYNVNAVYGPFDVSKNGHLYINDVEVTDAVIPEGKTTIQQGQFRYIVGLTAVTIPTTLTQAHMHCFYGCSNITRINISDLNSYLNINFHTDNAHPFSGNSNGGNVYLNGNMVTSVTYPSSMTAVKALSMYRSKGLTSVTLHSGITSIGASAFSQCSGLTSITIPSSVTSIGSDAFYNCTNLEFSVNSTSITSVGGGAFTGTRITSFINTSPCSYASYVFNNCRNLTDVTITTNSGMNVPTNWFNACGNPDNPGTLTINGNVNSTGNFNTTYFSKIIINGNLLAGPGTGLYKLTQMIINGDCSGGTSMGLCYNSGNTFKFLEISGDVKSSSKLFYGNYSNVIMHLSRSTKVTGTPSNWSLEYTSKIYVGDGSSQAADQAVLDQYLADTNWDAYASKLDLWYNYTGEYKNS